MPTNPHSPTHTHSTEGRSRRQITAMKPLGRLLVAAVAASLVATSLLVATLLTTPALPFLPLLPCLPAVTAPSGAGYAPSGLGALADAAAYYATTRAVPQQSRAEIALSLDVLRRRAPARMLVFGLGHDSPLWHALNPDGATLFLEEDPEWYRVVRSQSPHLRALLVRYRTRLDHADLLLGSYKQFPSCVPGDAGADPAVRANAACPLALHDLPPEVYDNEWDVLMVDAPKGYFPSAPGRMAAIWTAAAMARSRRGQGDTDVFLHDVDRRVERMYADEFLCDRFRVGGTGRLWHFRIPPVSRRVNKTTAGERPFC